MTYYKSAHVLARFILSFVTEKHFFFGSLIVFLNNILHTRRHTHMHTRTLTQIHFLNAYLNFNQLLDREVYFTDKEDVSLCDFANRFRAVYTLSATPF